MFEFSLSVELKLEFFFITHFQDEHIVLNILTKTFVLFEGRVKDLSIVIYELLLFVRGACGVFTAWA